MKINAHSSMQKAADFLAATIDRNRPVAHGLSGMELSIGPSGTPGFNVDAGALQAPLIVGDSRLVGDSISTSALDALFKQNPEAVRVLPKWNSQTRKFDIHLVDAARPFVGDAAPNLVAAQLLSPNGISQITSVFKRPLIKSAAKRLVNTQNGTDPWAEVMSMYLADFAGFAALPTAGALNNTMSQDVEVTSGLMTSQVINMDVTYRLSVEELERAKATSGNVPYAGQLIAQKQAYADWALDMLQSSLIYFGNASTGTLGLLTAGSGAVAWSAATLKEIAAGSSTSKGSDMYAGLAKAIADFLTANQNMVNKVRVAVSPYAMNLLTTTAYSAQFNPTSALKAMLENIMPGENTEGQIPDIEIMADPLLAPNTIFNSTSADYLVITSPEIGGGPDFEAQPLIVAGTPLDKFVYPVIPGQYGTPYKTLRRYAGIFAPYTPAIAVYSGFGTDTGV